LVCKYKSTRNYSDNKQINVGVILPLTGELSSYGIEAKKGLELGIEKLENKVNLIFEDSKADPKTAVNSFNKL
jgi:ABC-type branched-subunit amino acid transport system substrate-binding protein